MHTLSNMLDKRYLAVIIRLISLISRDKRGPKDTKSIEHYLDKIFYLFETGISWRKLPLYEGDLHFSSYHFKFMWLCKNRIFEHAHEIIIKILKKKGVLNRNSLKNLFIDSTMIKNICGKDSYGPNHYDRSKNGNKVTVVVNNKGIPLGISITKSNVNDVNEVIPTLNNIKIKLVNSRMYADKGYLSTELTKKVKQDHKITLVVPSKRNQVNFTPLTEYDKAQLRTRNIVENFFAWFKGQRRIRLRYDAHITTYTQFCYLALIKIINLKVRI